MAKSCPFCDQRKIAARVFRDHGRWCSLLAAPHITKGHAIVAVKAGGAGCPTEINSDILSGLDTALADVSSALMAFYQPKRVLFASLRGHVEHVHFHAVPLWKDEEAQWRNEVGYQSGHLLEFLGHLEKREFARREAIMKERGLGNEQYRAEIQSALLPDVQRFARIHQIHAGLTFGPPVVDARFTPAPESFLIEGTTSGPTHRETRPDGQGEASTLRTRSACGYRLVGSGCRPGRRYRAPCAPRSPATPADATSYSSRNTSAWFCQITSSATMSRNSIRAVSVNR